MCPKKYADDCTAFPDMPSKDWRHLLFTYNFASTSARYITNFSLRTFWNEKLRTFWNWKNFSRIKQCHSEAEKAVKIMQQSSLRPICG